MYFLLNVGLALKAKLVSMAEQINPLGVIGLAAQDVVIARRVLLAIIAQLTQDVSSGSKTC